MSLLNQAVIELKQCMQQYQPLSRCFLSYSWRFFFSFLLTFFFESVNIWYSSAHPWQVDFHITYPDEQVQVLEKNINIYWWLIRVTLVVAWWLFAPKFWEVVGTYESLFCSKMNAASVVVTCEVVGTLNHYKMVKKNFELCALRGGGDIKTFRLSLAP